MVTSVLVSWEAIEERPALFYGMLLLLEFGCLGVFCGPGHHPVLRLLRIHADSAVLPDRHLGQRAAPLRGVKFFLYTLAGSVLTFLGLLAIVLWDFRTTRAAGHFPFPS